MFFFFSRFQYASLAVVSALFLSSGSMAMAAKNDNTKESKNIYSDYSDFNLLLPINASHKLTLSVNIDKSLNFKPGDDFQKMQEAKFFEFIPKAEDINNWTEIITVILKLNIQLPDAATFNALMIEGFQKKTTDLSIIKRHNKKYKNYNDDEMFLVYTYNGKRELVWSYVVAGPLDAVNVQYTIRIPDSDKSKNFDSYIKKIENFKKKYTTIID